MSAAQPPHITMLAVQPADVQDRAASPAPPPPAKSVAPVTASDPAPRVADQLPNVSNQLPSASDQLKSAAPPSSGGNSLRFVLFVLGLGISSFFGVVVVRALTRPRLPVRHIHPDEAWNRRDLLMQELTDDDGDAAAVADTRWYQEGHLESPAKGHREWSQKVHQERQRAIPREPQRRQVDVPSPARMLRNLGVRVRDTLSAEDEFESVDS